MPWLSSVLTIFKWAFVFFTIRSSVSKLPSPSAASISTEPPELPSFRAPSWTFIPSLFLIFILSSSLPSGSLPISVVGSHPTKKYHWDQPAIKIYDILLDPGPYYFVKRPCFSTRHPGLHSASDYHSFFSYHCWNSPETFLYFHHHYSSYSVSLTVQERWTTIELFAESDIWKSMWSYHHSLCSPHWHLHLVLGMPWPWAINAQSSGQMKIWWWFHLVFWHPA